MLKARLKEKIKTRKAKIVVIGTGRVGLPMAVILANIGFSVTGIDKNPKIVNAVSNCRSPINERGLKEAISRAVCSGKLKMAYAPFQALRKADIIIVCVQTPIKKNKEVDLSFLKEACDIIARTLSKGKLIVIRSTLPPKTTKNYIAPLLEKRSGLRCGADFWLVYSPERMAPGNAFNDFVTNSGVLGVLDDQSGELGLEFFKLVTKGELYLTDTTTAEVTKLAENTFRYINIAFANELALICKDLGVDFINVFKLANSHPRVNIHMPGCGVGGPCLSKDAFLLLGSVKSKKFRPEIIAASARLNAYMPKYTVQLVTETLKLVGKNVKNSRIAVLGTAYKAEVDDARNSPAEEIIRKLISLGAEVVVFDPYCEESFGAKRAMNINEAVNHADCIVITADHKAFRKLNLSKIRGMMKENPLIIDGRYTVNPEQARAHGFIYVSIYYNTVLPS